MITKLRSQWMLSGMRQGDIARELGIVQSKVSAWCNGVYPIPPRHISKLCEIFQCNPEDIIGWTDKVLERDGKIL